MYTASMVGSCQWKPRQVKKLRKRFGSCSAKVNLVVSYSSEYRKGCGLAQGWYADTSTAAALTNIGFDARQQFLIRAPDPKGSFQCAIPMKHIFGFMDDYTKVT